MYAIVEIGGQQHKVTKAQKLYVNLLESEEGSNLEFDKVLLVDNNGEVSIGFPFVDGTRVAATIVGHVKDDKIHIFKHKRRKGYRRFNGHRQPLTEIFIQGILGKGETLKETLEVPKRIKKDYKTEAPVVETDVETGEVAPKKKAAAPKKKAAATKKATGETKAKKPVAKKSSPKKKSKE
jgi:large subunit ribosomal protein L21